MESTIAFVGQCHLAGQGLDSQTSFPQVTRRWLESSRPGFRCNVVLEQYHHPWDLRQAVDKVLRVRPHIVVIEAPGWLVVKGTEAVDLSRFPSRVRSAYDRIRHFRFVSGRVASAMPRTVVTAGTRVQTSSIRTLARILSPLLPRYPRPTIEEFGACLEDAILQVRENTGNGGRDRWPCGA